MLTSRWGCICSIQYMGLLLFCLIATQVLGCFFTDMRCIMWWCWPDCNFTVSSLLFIMCWFFRIPPRAHFQYYGLCIYLFIHLFVLYFWGYYLILLHFFRFESSFKFLHSINSQVQTLYCHPQIQLALIFSNFITATSSALSEEGPELCAQLHSDFISWWFYMFSLL